MTQRPFLGWFVSPAVLLALGLAAAMAAILQYSVRAYVPGSLDVGGLTFENFTTLLRPFYLWAFWNTILLCLMTATFTLILAYPVAYALVRVNNKALKSFILIAAITPLFLGEVVRTYSWMIVLGNNGFINSVLMALGIIDSPLQMMFTTSGVVAALVHVTMPIMVIMLAAGLSHIDRNYEKAAESLGAGPIRCFMTVTLPLSMPGVVAGFSTAFAWTFSAFATPQLIGGGKVNTVSTLVYQLGFSSFNFPFAASLSFAGLVMTFAVLALMKRAMRPIERLGEQ
ncbi:MAG: ABC transporter permease [Alphaproteobacteria bacterium]|nr:ABC transporter permease [Alphaproteobacteria bacterium]MBU1549530.1 ABC transporter permease [Alphaproteobacteria bacterium]MBU2336385.1 ABC transporter permease [Alphaproteobacteria bacterium]MBU2387734.1 ABC transporter permease [Alphaproteobacteria bacterium]